jgi:outer membrane protein assembly factor BamE (lipoprotein component of BamABCDE complex)
MLGRATAARATVVAALVAVVAACSADRSADGFSRADWQGARAGRCESVGDARWSMLDAAEYTLRRGMTKKQARALLGAPDAIVDPIGARTRSWDYWLGFQSGFKVDCDILTLDFDGNGRLRHWSDWQD